MNTILIILNSTSLGDTIGVMPCIEKFISNTTDNVLVKTNPRYNFLFSNSYPMVKFFEEGMEFDKQITLDYNFNLPLQTGFANQLGFMDWEYVQPKVDVPDTWTSKVLVNLVQRRMIKLTTVMDAPAVVAVDKKVAKPRVVKESKRKNS